MNKFIANTEEIKEEKIEDTKILEKDINVTEEIKEESKKENKKNYEIIKKGKQEFKKCGKCFWIHTIETKKCQFCGNKF